MIVVVPELAAVPVLRTVSVQVPLGVVLCWLDCAVHWVPPSDSDMLRSAVSALAAPCAAVCVLASKTAHPAITSSQVRTRLPRFIQHACSIESAPQENGYRAQ